MRVKHIVGFSGGIDSQAAARWVLNRFPVEDVIMLNSNAGGNEHPLTDGFVVWYSANVHPVVTVEPVVADMWITPGWAEAHGYGDGNAPLDFPALMAHRKRPPSRKAQFCTEILKLRPQKRWMAEQFGPSGQYAGQEYCRYTGVRRDESESRKNAKYVFWDEWFDCFTYAPLVDWPKAWCFDYMKQHGEQINPLYTLGFSRVGCAPCINSGKEDITNWAIRFPEMIDKVREWEQRTGITFFMPVGRDGKSNGVDEVVRWAKSARGGRQDLFPIMHERDACESKYGLCE